MAEQQTVETSAESIEEAIQKGLIELGASRNDVRIEIIEEGSLGILGIGKKDAVVKLSLLAADANVEDVPAEVVEAAVLAEELEEAFDEIVAAESAEIDVEPELEQEAEIALDIVSTLIKKMGYEVEVRAEIAPADDLGQRIVLVNIMGDDIEPLIGERGIVLNKVQFLARSMASQRLGDRTSFVVDIDNYRQKRQDELVKIANDTAAKAANYKRAIALPPMPPHERRIIHMTLRDDARVTTESKGDGDRRRVRIIPKGMRSRSYDRDRRGGGGGYRGGGNSRGGYRGGGRRY